MIITTVLKTNNIYNKNWVDKMKRALDRHMSTPFEFLPLTDQTHDYASHDIQYDHDGYWNKIELFRPSLYDGPTLYIDLDNVITGDLSPLIQSLQGNGFVMWRGRVTEKQPVPVATSTIMYWDECPNHLWDTWNTQPKTVWYKKYKSGRLGDQAFIRDNTEFSYVQDLYKDAEQTIASAKQPSDINSRTAMIVFAGNAKPHTCAWPSVKQNWHDI